MYSHSLHLKHPYTTRSATSVFVDHVVRMQGVPTSIVSDRDLAFTSYVWCKLFKEVGTSFCYSTAYHLRSADGLLLRALESMPEAVSEHCRARVVGAVAPYMAELVQLVL